MSVVSKLFGRLTKTVRNVGRRTRKVGRNTANVARAIYKPVTNLVGLTKRSRKSRRRQ